MILDNATAAGLDLPALSPAERAEAERVIGRITGDGNPFDAWGNGDYAVNVPHAMSVVNDSERISAIVYCADTGNDGQLGHPGRVLENVKMLVEAAQRSHKPHYLMSPRPGVVNLRQSKALREAGPVQIGGTRQGLGAIDRIARYMTEQKPVRHPRTAPGRNSPICSRRDRDGAPSTNMIRSGCCRVLACRSRAKPASQRSQRQKAPRAS